MATLGVNLFVWGDYWKRKDGRSLAEEVLGVMRLKEVGYSLALKAFLHLNPYLMQIKKKIFLIGP